MSLFRYVGGRKLFIVLSAIAGAFVNSAADLGVQPEQVDTCLWVAAGAAFAIALEDGLKAFKKAAADGEITPQEFLEALAEVTEEEETDDDKDD